MENTPRPGDAEDDDTRESPVPPPVPPVRPVSGGSGGGSGAAAGRWSRRPEDLSGEKLLRNCPRVTFDGEARPAFGRYALLSKLGQGGMGVVYHAVHAKLGTEVAIKVLPLALHAQQDDLVERFEREARLAAQLRSDHLVSVLDIDEDAPTGCHFIVMEYVRGVTADRWARRQPSAPGVPEVQALDVVIAATRGLVAAHLAGVVHRDIKPANILVPCDAAGRPLHERAKLADLGLARAEASEQSLTTTALAMGTPGYMAPEQAQDSRRARKTSDVFSVGATLYALLAGRAPFAGTSPADAIVRTAAGAYLSILDKRPDVTEATARLIDHCLRPDPQERFPDAPALLDALLLARAATESGEDASRTATSFRDLVARPEQGKPVETPRPPPHAQAARRRSVFFVAAALVALSAVAVSVAFLVGGDRRATDRGESTGSARSAPGLFSIASVPAGAEVLLDGESIGRTPRIDVPAAAGSHALLLRLAEHGEVTRTFDVHPGVPTDLGTAHLQRWPVIELPDLSPGVSASIDGAARSGRVSVAPGKHRVALSQVAHADQVEEPDCALGQVIRISERDWARFQARLDLTGIPSDAEATIEGSPAAGVVTFAETRDVEVVVVRAGLEPQRVRVRVELGRLSAPELGPWTELAGTVDLSEFGDDVRFERDGTPIGDGAALPPGPHKLRVLRDGHQPQEVTVVSTSGGRTRPALGPWVVLAGTLDLSQLPTECRFEIDGKSVTDGASLAPGKYLLRVTRGNVPPYVVTVVVRAGQASAVPPPPWAPLAQALSDAIREGILTDPDVWNAATADKRRLVAEWVDSNEPDFALLRLERFSCGGRTHEVAVYSHAPTGMEFALVPAGTFSQGSPEAEPRRDPDETQHEVKLTRPFLMARTETTQAAWERVMGSNPAEFREASRPVEQVSWNDALSFCSKAGLALPTEAQWEYACRAGTKTAFAPGEPPDALQGFANILDRRAQEHRGEIPYDSSRWSFAPEIDDGHVTTAPVASFRPNAFGIFDMHGNVWEWCADAYGPYPPGVATDPIGADGGAGRVFRGGSWSGPARNARSASRMWSASSTSNGFLGFRPAKAVPLD